MTTRPHSDTDFAFDYDGSRTIFHLAEAARLAVREAFRADDDEAFEAAAEEFAYWNDLYDGMTDLDNARDTYAALKVQQYRLVDEGDLDKAATIKITLRGTANHIRQMEKEAGERAVA